MLWRQQVIKNINLLLYKHFTQFKAPFVSAVKQRARLRGRTYYTNFKMNASLRYISPSIAHHPPSANLPGWESGQMAPDEQIDNLALSGSRGRVTGFLSPHLQYPQQQLAP